MSNQTTLAIGGLLAMTMLVGGSESEAGDGKYTFGQNELVVSEIPDLRRQIARCWKLSAITQREDFDVHIRVKLRPNGTVQTSRVVDYTFLIGDPYRLGVAKSARHAILSRSCNPLPIPKDRRQSGKRITLTLNPRSIFRR